eukprot:1155475-Pelagomonas_calceolata.AAC.1
MIVLPFSFYFSTPESNAQQIQGDIKESQANESSAHRQISCSSPDMLFIFKELVGSLLGARRWRMGEGESGCLGAWWTTLQIPMSSVLHIRTTSSLSCLTWALPDIMLHSVAEASQLCGHALQSLAKIGSDWGQDSAEQEEEILCPQAHD